MPAAFLAVYHLAHLHVVRLRNATKIRRFRSRTHIIVTPYGVLVAYSRWDVVKRAAAKFVTAVAILLVTFRMRRLARTYICLLILLGSLDALVAPFISGSINPGGNSDLSVQYNPKDSSITCVVSILGAIVSRQFLIPRIEPAIW
jgi:hypothetical protein